jgi:RimJ/RimL family protein N-acetyltransferase
MSLVTGEHCITEEVRTKLDEMYREPAYRTMFSPICIDFNIVDANTYNSESYIMYDGCEAVGLLKPTFDRDNQQVCNILPRVFAANRNRGYASYMFAWVIDEYFSRGYQKICTTVWSPNVASLALNRKFLVQEGFRPKQQNINGVLVDTHLFGLVREEYQNAKLLTDYYAIKQLVSETLGILQ